MLLLEKGTRFGGSMYLSSGIVWTFARQRDVRAKVPDGDPALQDLLVGQLTESLDWLQAQGAELQPERSYLGWRARPRGQPAADDGRTGRPHPVARRRAAFRHRGAKPALQRRQRHRRAGVGRCRRDRGSCRFGDPGDRRFPGQSRVAGALRDALRLVDVPAGQPLEHRRRLAGRARRRRGDHPWLDTFYGHALTAPPARFNAMQFQDMSHKYAPLAVALNLAGRRFTDESAGTGEECSTPTSPGNRRRPRPVCSTRPSPSDAFEGGPLARVVMDRARAAGGPVAQADTLEALAEQMQAWGLPPEQVVHTVQQLQRRGELRQRAASCSRHGAAITSRSRSRPSRAALVRAAITFTCGGLRADLDMRVLRRAASVSMLPLVTAPRDELQVAAIPGLYAAGCDVGGFSTKPTWAGWRRRWSPDARPGRRPRPAPEAGTHGDRRACSWSPWSRWWPTGPSGPTRRRRGATRRR